MPFPLFKMTNGRTKGHAYERKIAVDFQEMGFDAITKRAARGGDWSTTDDGIDLVGTEPFAVQVKRYRDYVPVNTIEEIQTTKEAALPPIGINVATGGLAWLGDDGRLSDKPTTRLSEYIPLLITKADHKPAMAVLPWDELKKLIRVNYPKS